MIILYILGWLALLLIASMVVLSRPYTEQEDEQRESFKDH